MIGLIADLSMGEAERREPGGEMGLISGVVAGLLGGGAVIAQPVGLDHEPQIRPEEVDPKAIQTLARERKRAVRPVPRAVGRVAPGLSR